MDARQSGAGVPAGTPLWITLIDMLEHGRALLVVQLRRVRTRQSRIERVFNGELELGPRETALPQIILLRTGESPREARP